MMNITPIFLLHGLGSHPITMYPLERHLNHQGYTNTYSVSYNPNREDIEEAVTEVDQIMMKMADKECDEIILIGQSMGGVVANRLHRRGWKVKKAIYIGSPLHGARMVKIARNWGPSWLIWFMDSPAWEYLSNKSKEYEAGNGEEEPPHDYHTISMGWWDTPWDSRVFKDETMFNPEKHTHLPREDHSLIFIKPKLWELVHEIISN